MGFVFVQHLDPGHESSLPHILAQATSMPVYEAKAARRVRPNEVYVIAPNTTLRLSRGRLVLKRRDTSRGPHHSIDVFFESLAEDRQGSAIGVVFSGVATDGTLGLEAIKAGGGITFAQDKSARYDSMPRSAIASGCVDHVMAPAAIAQELAQIAAHPCFAQGELEHTSTPKGQGRPGKDPTGFGKIMELARAQSGVDFTLYKTSTIDRRIARRMILSRAGSIEDYARLVSSDPKELQALYADLLINVTSFFRDEAAFDALKDRIFPKLLAQKSVGAFRMWSIGCSSGQEVYSLGMAFLEVADQLGHRAPKLQIFGTDLNETVLSKARHGLYPRSLAQEISPTRLRRFFVEEDGGYRVIKALREVCIFARQDLLRDPPFSRMDLVSCRNVLIYFDAVAQRRALPLLHYALKPGGVLFLGASESIGTFTALFEPMEKKQKLFTHKAAAPHPFSMLPRARVTAETKQAGPRASLPAEPLRVDLHAQREAERVMVNLFAPPGVLVDASLNILQFHGATEPFLAAASGKASLNVLKMARDTLRLPLRAAINRVRKTHDAIRREKVRLDGDQQISLRVIPLRNVRTGHFLILFEAPGVPAGPVSVAPEPVGRAGTRQLQRRNAVLEREISELRDYLESLQQQHDTAHDELQASNEEVQSTNEELQSINEELETSKEELESGNEELMTVNEEMAYRNRELSLLNSDLNNFHVSLSTPIVVFDRALTIRRFTPLAEKLFNLLATDIGRPISGIRHNLEFDDLEGFFRKVIDLLTARECEVRDKQGHWYLLRGRPYLTVDNKVDGAILVLLDIDALKRSEKTITQERDYAEATLRTARDPLVILRPDLTVNTANDAFYKLFGLTPAQTENRLLFDLADGAWNIPALRSLLADVLPRNHLFNDLEVTHPFVGLGERTLRLNGRRLENEAGEPLRILLSIEDVTERRRSSSALRASEIRYRRLFEAAKDGVLIVDPDSRRITDANPFMEQLLGYRHDEILGRELYEIGLFRDKEAAQESFLKLRETQQIRYDHLPLKDKQGHPHAVEVVANLYDEDGRAVIQCNVRDITERKRLEAALQASEAYFRELTQDLPIGVWTSKADGQVDFINRHWLEYTGIPLGAPMAYRDAWRTTVHPDDGAAAERIAEVARAGEEGYHLEARFRNAKSGAYRWFLKRSVPVRGANGELRKRIGICIDIDDLKQARDLLVTHAGELEDLVQTRTRALRDTIGELESFSYSVSHDMRAPLRAMQGFAELLLHKLGPTLDAESLDQLRRISISASRLDALISDVLTYSRLLRTDIVLQPVSLDALVRLVLATYPQLQAAGAQVMIDGPLPTVLAHDVSLTQCVSNLLSNAVKFMAPGVVAQVKVRAEEIGDDVRLWIEDNGIGIAPIDQPRIWQIFTQLGRAREYPGTGIGLAIVRKAVERMQGTIGVESELGQGSRFWLQLRKG